MHTPFNAPCEAVCPYVFISEVDWETRCLAREDGQHCNCWYDDKPCCACGEK